MERQTDQTDRQTDRQAHRHTILTKEVSGAQYIFPTDKDKHRLGLRESTFLTN